jgi:2'-5' RNA ligase
MAEIRCFIAVEVDDSDVVREISKIQQQLLSSGAKLKLVEPQNLHFTLHFLGNIDEERIPELANIIEQVKGQAFDVELIGVGCFRPQRPRVIWIGATTGAEQLIQHQKFLGRELRAHGFPSEKRKYSPHLTVLRVRSGLNREELMQMVDQYAAKEFGKFPVKAIKLKKSTLTPKGPIYEDLAMKELEVTDES